MEIYAVFWCGIRLWLASQQKQELQLLSCEFEENKKQNVIPSKRSSFNDLKLFVFSLPLLTPLRLRELDCDSKSIRDQSMCGKRNLLFINSGTGWIYLFRSWVAMHVSWVINRYKENPMALSLFFCVPNKERNNIDQTFFSTGCLFFQFPCIFCVNSLNKVHHFDRKEHGKQFLSKAHWLWSGIVSLRSHPVFLYWRMVFSLSIFFLP